MGFGISGVGMNSWLGMQKGIWKGSLCIYCGAIIKAGHLYAEGRRSGRYCPNCGIEMNRGVWDLSRTFPGSLCPSPDVRRKTRAKFWNCRQVPFPSRRLIVTTRKPKGILSEINF